MKRLSKGRLLLLELLLAVFIFSACALVCAAVFLKANDISDQSQQLTRGTFIATQAAEAFKSAQTTDEIARLVNGMTLQDGVITAEIDETWALAPMSKNAVGVLTIIIETRGNLELAEISVKLLNGDEICALSVSKYIAKEAA